MAKKKEAATSDCGGYKSLTLPKPKKEKNTKKK